MKEPGPVSAMTTPEPTKRPAPITPPIAIIVSCRWLSAFCKVGVALIAFLRYCGWRVLASNGATGFGSISPPYVSGCGVQDGFQRGFCTLLRNRFAVLIEGGDEVGVLGGTTRQQRLDAECFARIARNQQPTGGVVEARLGHFEG